MSRIWEWLKEWWFVILAGIVVLSFVGALFWAVFTYEPLTEGIVIGKEYTPAHSVYSPIHMTVNGVSQTIPRWRNEPEKWRVTVQNGDATDLWYVSQAYYESVKIGDWVTK